MKVVFLLTPQGRKKLEWYIRAYQKRTKGMWGIFSEELIRLKLKDSLRNKYEVNCSGNARCITSIGASYKDSYLLSMLRNKKAIKEAFYFGAAEMIRIGGLKDFPEYEVRKLGEF